MNKDFSFIRQYWEPVKAGSTKVMVFQYGKVASTAVVKGLKVYSKLAPAHAHTAEQAKGWLSGQATGIPWEQQGFALSQDRVQKHTGGMMSSTINGFGFHIGSR